MTELAFAFGAGLLATVNPCGFALLPAFLSFYLGDKDDAETRSVAGRVAQGFAVGGAVSTGFAGVFIAAGLLVSAGLRPLLRLVPWAAFVIGVVLIGVGVALLAGRHVGLTVTSPVRQDERRSYARVVTFGGAYALASLSCTLAVFLAVVGQALAAANPIRLLGIFLAYGAGAATVLTALTVSASFAKGALHRAVRRLLPLAGRLGGAFLVLSGLYLVAYWLPAIRHPGSPGRSPVAGLTDRLSATLTTFISDNRGAFVALAIILAATALSLLGWTRLRPADGEAPSPDPDCCSTQPASFERERVEV